MGENTMTSVYRGHELIYDVRNDVWMPAAHDLPVAMGTLPEVCKSIDKWEIEKQIEGGFEVWSLRDDRPDYWGKRQAVFRRGKPKSDPDWYSNSTHEVMTRNFQGDPDSLFGIARGYIAMDTPEVREAIEEARKAYDAVKEASRRYKEAKNRIPTMTEEEWLTLPERGA